MYEPGIHGWWRFLRLLDLMRDGDGVQWAGIVRRTRPSARLRQCEQERAYWASKS
jgi:hypothetical protein